MRPSVLLTTEGTYPFILGGVSTWCDILVNGLPGVDWSVLPLTAGGLHRASLFEFPTNVTVAGHVDLWSETSTRGTLCVVATMTASTCRTCWCVGCWGGTAIPRS